MAQPVLTKLESSKYLSEALQYWQPKLVAAAWAAMGSPAPEELAIHFTARGASPVAQRGDE
jgi:hypothetical protein